MMWKWNNVPIPPQDLVGLILGGILQYLFPQMLIANPRVGDILGWLLIAIGSGIVVGSVKEAGDIDI